jgi:hypothetical protein
MGGNAAGPVIEGVTTAPSRSLRVPVNSPLSPPLLLYFFGPKPKKSGQLDLRFIRNERARGLKKVDIAPRSSEEEDRHKRETFCRNPAGNQSRPAEPGQQPEASLARWRVTSTAKRRQPDQTPCYRAPKSSLVGSPRRCPKRGPCRALATPGPNWRARSRRGQRTGRMITRVPRELGRPCRLHRHCRPEPPAYQLRVDPQPSPGLMGTNKGHTDGIAKRRQRSAARRASGSRSAP